MFYILWNKIQVTEYTPDGLAYGGNGGTATSKGLELSTAFRFTPELRAGMAATYTNAYLTDDIPSLDGRSGDQLPQSPRWNVSLSTDYQTPVADKGLPRLRRKLSLPRHRLQRLSELHQSDFRRPSRCPNGAPEHREPLCRLIFERTQVKLFATNVFNNYSFTGIFNRFAG